MLTTDCPPNRPLNISQILLAYPQKNLKRPRASRKGNCTKDSVSERNKEKSAEGVGLDEKTA